MTPECGRLDQELRRCLDAAAFDALVHALAIGQTHDFFQRVFAGRIDDGFNAHVLGEGNAVGISFQAPGPARLDRAR